MGATALKTFGWLLILTALGLTFYAYRLWNQPPPPPQVIREPAAVGPQVVVALRALPSGQSLTADDVTLAPVTVMPDGAFREMGQVTGRRTTRPVGKGQALTADDFRGISLARQLHAGERAVALKIDLVRGVGGFLQPGDRVDVLLYLKQDGDEVANSQSRLLLQDVRLLCYGETCDRFRAEGAKSVVDREQGVRQDSGARTAVLAVPDKSTTRLLLGAGSGDLRLALRSPEAQVGADGGMLAATADGLGDGALNLPDLLGHRPAPVHARRRSPVVAEVIRGTRVERLSR